MQAIASTSRLLSCTCTCSRPPPTFFRQLSTTPRSYAPQNRTFFNLLQSSPHSSETDPSPNQDPNVQLALRDVKARADQLKNHDRDKKKSKDSRGILGRWFGRERTDGDASDWARRKNLEKERAIERMLRSQGGKGHPAAGGSGGGLNMRCTTLNKKGLSVSLGL